MFNIHNENFKHYYEDSTLLLADFEHCEIKYYGMTPNQASQNVKKLSEMWRKVNASLSLQPNILNDANNIDDR